MLGEVKIFGCYIEGFLRIEVGFDVLEHEGGFPYSARADEARRILETLIQAVAT